MSLPWFRMYHEFSGDPVIQCLSFDDQRHFVMVLCLKAAGFLDRSMPSPQFRERAIAQALGLDTIAAAEVRRRLAEVGLVGEDWQPTNWTRRQFRSDNSTARVQKFRAKTPEEEDKTDTERNVTRNVSETVKGIELHDSLPAEEWAEWLAHRKARRWPCDPLTLKKQLNRLAKHDTPTQREMIDTAIQSGWQGLFAPRGTGTPQQKAGGDPYAGSI